MDFSQDAASALALQALAWLVGNDELLPVFMGATGASVDDLKDQAASVTFQASVLEFLTMDDAWVMGFCDAAGHPYESPMRALQVLAGESGRHWT